MVSDAYSHNLLRGLEDGVVLHDQLLFQVPRAFGHCVPRIQEETNAYVASNVIPSLAYLLPRVPTCVPPFCYRFALLLSVKWPDQHRQFIVLVTYSAAYQRCIKSWAVIVLNLAVHVVMCEFW